MSHVPIKVIRPGILEIRSSAQSLPLYLRTECLLGFTVCDYPACIEVYVNHPTNRYIRLLHGKHDMIPGMVNVLLDFMSPPDSLPSESYRELSDRVAYLENSLEELGTMIAPAFEAYQPPIEAQEVTAEVEEAAEIEEAAEPKQQLADDAYESDRETTLDICAGFLTILFTFLLITGFLLHLVPLYPSPAFAS